MSGADASTATRHRGVRPASGGHNHQSGSRTKQKRITMRNEKYNLLWYCDYCDVFVSTKQRTRKQHLEGRSHTQNMEAYYNKLKREVSTLDADYRHTQSLGVWNPDTIQHDWRVELLQTSQQERRLDNIVRYRTIQIQSNVGDGDGSRGVDGGPNISEGIVTGHHDVMDICVTIRDDPQIESHSSSSSLSTTTAAAPLVNVLHRTVVAPHIVVGGIAPGGIVRRPFETSLAVRVGNTSMEMLPPVGDDRLVAPHLNPTMQSTSAAATTMPSIRIG